MIPDQVKAVVFDAVGTLIQPDPPAHVVYADAGRRFGSKLDPGSIQERFTAAFRRQEVLDHQAGLRTSEERERQRWRTIVAEVLYEGTDFERCFAELYDHFSLPPAWRVDEEGIALAAELLRRGYRVGLASNYDHRLRSLVAGTAELRHFSPVVISSEVGWRKPAPGFFAALRQAVGLAAPQILYLGDDPGNDYQGAHAAGLQAVLFDPGDRCAPGMHRIKRFGEMLGRGPSRQ
jgi:putative hydrolase of the HAD superfamily